MSRYSTFQETPANPTFEGDQKFTSVNMKLSRDMLPADTLALSINKRLRRGVAETRDGIWPPTFANVLDPPVISGFGVFSDPDGEERILVASGDVVYSIRDGQFPLTIPVSKTLGSSVEFVQAGEKVYIFQGKDKVQQVWDGKSSMGFVEITKSDPLDTSTKLIPPAITAEHFANRLLVIQDSNVILSDILDYTSYDPILEVFYVNSGASGVDSPLVRVMGYAKGIAIVFGAHSINLMLNFTGDPTLASVELLNSQLGLVGRKAVTMLGGDVLFLSEPGGIYRVAQSFESRLQTVNLPITDPIQPLIERINWSAASGSVAASLGEYVYFAVPIDGSTTNNAMIVYNGATGIIEGYDTFPASFQISDLCTARYEGERRLFALDKDAARVYVMYEGKSDFVYEMPGDGSEVPGVRVITEHAIRDRIETRGFSTLGWNAASRRDYPASRGDFRQVEISVASWHPSIVVTQLTERAGDERALNTTPIEKSRTEYDVFGEPDWDTTNVNDDWNKRGRQDYMVQADDTGFIPGSGIIPDQAAQSTIRFSTRARGRYVSYRIENSLGAGSVHSCLLKSAETQREQRRAG